jgi:hypothetical protein
MLDSSWLCFIGVLIVERRAVYPLTFMEHLQHPGVMLRRRGGLGWSGRERQRIQQTLVDVGHCLFRGGIGLRQGLFGGS